MLSGGRVGGQFPIPYGTDFGTHVLYIGGRSSSNPDLNPYADGFRTGQLCATGTAGVAAIGLAF